MKKFSPSDACVKLNPHLFKTDKKEWRESLKDPMNKLERAFASRLNVLQMNGSIHRWVFEGVTLHWGGGMRYTPDFLIVDKETMMTLVEIKGFRRSRDIVRFKGCKNEWDWCFNFEMWAREDGQWTRLY